MFGHFLRKEVGFLDTLTILLEEMGKKILRGIYWLQTINI